FRCCHCRPWIRTTRRQGPGARRQGGIRWLQQPGHACNEEACAKAVFRSLRSGRQVIAHPGEDIIASGKLRKWRQRPCSTSRTVCGTGARARAGADRIVPVRRVPQRALGHTCSGAGREKQKANGASRLACCVFPVVRPEGLHALALHHFRPGSYRFFAATEPSGSALARKSIWTATSRPWPPGLQTAEMDLKLATWP